MTQNYAIGTDLTCHSDLISISTQLMAARLSTVDGDADDRRLCLSLLDHDLKLANIFQHIFSGQKPLFIPKGQKSDIFMNARELQALNSRGYFGNDYFYLKIYKIIKLMHDNYKVSPCHAFLSTPFTKIRHSLTFSHRLRSQQTSIRSCWHFYGRVCSRCRFCLRCSIRLKKVVPH